VLSITVVIQNSLQNKKIAIIKSFIRNKTEEQIRFYLDPGVEEGLEFSQSRWPGQSGAGDQDREWQRR